MKINAKQDMLTRQALSLLYLYDPWECPTYLRSEFFTMHILSYQTSKQPSSESGHLYSIGVDMKKSKLLNHLLRDCDFRLRKD
jgi:hypothetical protein